MNEKNDENKDIPKYILDKKGERAIIGVTHYMPPEEMFPVDSLGVVGKFNNNLLNSNKNIEHVILDKKGELATFRVTHYKSPEEMFPVDSLGVVGDFNKCSSLSKYTGLDAGFGILKQSSNSSGVGLRLDATSVTNNQQFGKPRLGFSYDF